ncbi:MAG: hypothetical protein FJW36_00560 [Acidobacteria bacterium]|nr:hypothetical protein [Acidobacteriota bacterium]
MSAPGFGENAEQLRRATVQVRIDEGRSASGSGVIWNGQGAIVSNAHVVRGENVEVEFWNGEVVRARILKRNARRDLALLSTDRPAPAAARWADSGRLIAGEQVLAVGNPLGFIGALSRGIVHGVGPFRNLGRQDWVQASIRLAPGNSGGALADSSGAVVGINTMIAGSIGLAVPSSDVAKFIDRPAAPVLGITVEPLSIQLNSRPAVDLRIQQVMLNSRAHFASLRPGDVIIGLDGEFFSSPEDLEDRLMIGGLVHLGFLRDGKPVAREVAIALGPEEPGRLAAAG